MDRQRALRISCACVMFVMLAGCGGGGGGTSGSGGGAITTAQRTAALTAVTTYYSTLPHTNQTSDSQAMADYIKKRPEFEASGTSDDGDVWARFTDGRMFVFVNNPKPAPAGLRSAAIPAAAPDTHRAVPTGKKAYALLAMGAGYQDGAARVAGTLLSKGYSVVAGSSAISVLKNVNQAGVFYIDTHGDKCVRRDGQEVFTLGTSEKVTPEDDEAYKDDLDSGRLVYMAELWNVDAEGNGTLEDHYGITPDFVTKYITMSSGSLVYVDACYSYDPSMMAAFKAKGATTYFGWTRAVQDVDAYNTAQYFFDRVLGTNLYDPKLDPPQRPFDIAAIYGELDKFDLGRSLPPGRIVARLKYVTSGDDTAVDLLTPTILRLQPVEEEDTLNIVGLFGPDPGADGKVTIGGVKVLVRKWTKDTIAVVLPESGDGSGGGVCVEVRGHKSNEVPLTEWWPTFRYTYHGEGTVEFTMTFHLHIRADVHSYRMTPGETPREGEWSYTLAKDSTATVGASGSFTDPTSGAVVSERLLAAPSVPLNGDNSRTFEGSGTITTAPPGGARSMRIDLYAHYTDCIETTVQPPSGPPIVGPDSFEFSMAGLTQDTNGIFAVGLDDNYNITAGTRINGPFELDWDTAYASYAPKPKGERSAALPGRKKR